MNIRREKTEALGSVCSPSLGRVRLLWWLGCFALLVFSPNPNFCLWVFIIHVTGKHIATQDLTVKVATYIRKATLGRTHRERGSQLYNACFHLGHILKNYSSRSLVLETSN